MEKVVFAYVLYVSKPCSRDVTKNKTKLFVSFQSLKTHCVLRTIFWIVLSDTGDAESESFLFFPS